MFTHTRIDSPHLAGSAWTVERERDVFVYLPVGYGESADHYATTYLLHADGETARSIVDPATDGPRWHVPLEDVVAPVFGRRGVAPMIVVVPDGASTWGCGQWVDSPVSGHFESYVVNDVVAYVDEHFRTLARPSSRGLFGYSSGGLGAWNIASRHPDVFAAAAVLSGDCDFEVLKSEIYGYFDSVWPEGPRGPNRENDLSCFVYAYAAAYSPNLDCPPHYVDLPIDFRTGDVREEVWRRWLDADPLHNWRSRCDGLRALRGLLIDVGVRDQHRFHWAWRRVSHALRDAGITHSFLENAGDHGGRTSERFQVALEWLATVLVHEAGAGRP